eukprot:597973_1
MAKAAPSTQSKDNCCQILMCGDGGCGKTALAASFIGDDLTNIHEKYNPTIQNEYYRVNFEVDGTNVSRVDIKDPQGQEEYTSIRLATISDTDAFVLVYDVTNKASLSELTKWIKEIKDAKLKENEYKGIPFVLVGMKCDLVKHREVTEEEGQQMANELNGCPFFEACATPKQQINVIKVFESVIREWRQYEKYSVQTYQNQIKKRKQGSKLENFMQGLGLFNKINEDAKQTDEAKHVPPHNEDRVKDNVVLSLEMESIIDDMCKEQSEENGDNNQSYAVDNQNANVKDVIQQTLLNK